ncbi:hypothetical protein AAE478_009035 [Parahypoxylon ruwenzoriense]
MASSNASGDEAPSPSLAPVPALEPHYDPFIAATSPLSSSHHRFSGFESQLFALGPNASPAQAKRALEAHLAETERRMEEAGKLGTALVQQRKELGERLKEVEKLQAEGELSDELRQKLIEIEKDYNEVAKESARAFLPKQRVPSNEAAAGSPFVPEGKGGRRSVSPSKFEGQATGSPTKFNVPNRKVRNQPANRVHDIEFAAEISTSLIAQVRNLQGLLAEKEEELKEIRVEKSKLEYEAEGFQQRVKNLDESEHRYKDENWNLETQIHDLLAKEREALDREKKLTQSLNILQAEKNATQRELDEVKLIHARLGDEYAAAIKHHDIELGTAKRSKVIADAERVAMRRRIDDLTGQNQELAKAVSASQRAKVLERESILNMGEDNLEAPHDGTTPEHSPPPSPVKGTPRHAMLETETLKTSLGHAQRTIQGLRSNVHREKTEKLELRRMLQEARDEIEKLRHEPPPPSRRARKAESKEFKKPSRLLGGLRTVRSEVFSEDSNWEDQPDSISPTRSSLRSRGSSKFESLPEEEPSEHFETANETSDAAFETANEPPTETDDFHTGAEDFSSDDDDDDDVETETDSPSKRLTPRNRQPTFSSALTRRASFHSTASTEDEDYPFDHGRRTPTMLPSLPPLQQKFPLRVGRGALRRSRAASEEPPFHSSPPSIASSSVTGTPKQRVQSLAAELGDFDASDNESNLSMTPSRRSIRGRTASPPPPVPPLPRAIMIDSGTMTEGLLASSSPASHASVIGPSRPFSMNTVASRFSTSSYDSVAQDMGEKLAKFPSPPTSPPRRRPGLIPEPGLSTVHSHVVDPLSEHDAHAAELAALKAEHEKILNEFSTEKAAEYSAALEELKTQHAHQLDKLRTEASDAHAQELGTLKSNHATEISRAVAEAQAAHAGELEALKSSHLQEINKSAVEANAVHVREIGVLKSNHDQEISKAVGDIQSLHAQELQALKSSHAEELSKALAEAHATHAQQLDELQSSYADRADKATAESQAAHAQELEALKSDLAGQMSQKELEIKAAHDAELEALKSSHAEQIATREHEVKATHVTELEILKDGHADQIDSLKNELSDAHAKELETLKSDHSEQLDRAKQESDAAHSEELELLKSAHTQHVEEVRNALATAHGKELDLMRSTHATHIDNLKRESEAQRAAEISSLVASHGKELESIKTAGEATLAKELAALKENHAQEIDSLNSQHAAARAQELETFKAAIAKQVESSKTEGDAAHTQQIEALNAAHAEVLEAQKRDSEKSQIQAIESLKAAHERHVEALKNDNAATRSKELDEVASRHIGELDALRKEHESSKVKVLEDLSAAHSQQLEDLRQGHLTETTVLKTEHESVVQKLGNGHSKELEELREEIESSKAVEIAALRASHVQDLEALKSEHEVVLSRKMQELAYAHSHELETLRQDGNSTKSEALASLTATHTAEIESLKAKYEEAQSQKLHQLADNYTRELERLQQESDTTKSEALATLAAAHASEFEGFRNESEVAHLRQLDDLKVVHADELDALQKQSEVSQSEALEALRASHSEQLAQLKSDADAALAKELEAIKAEHASILKSHEKDSAAEKERLLVDHTAELEALRKSLETTIPALGISSMSSIDTEPIENSESRSPRREAFIIPREDRPETPTSTAIGLFGRKGKNIPTPEIAEDDTRQSPSATPGPETPESQRPFKEISTNVDIRPSRKPAANTTDQSSQTSLTSDGLDRLMKRQGHSPQDPAITATRGEVTVTPLDEARAKQRNSEPGVVSAPEPIPARRPGSSASGRGSLNRPPLPANHREVIEAARTHSSSGGKGTMGPPPLPASAYRGPASRPDTPSSRRPMSPSSAKGTPTPRAGKSPLPGHADVHSSARLPLHSRQSSVSSFVSEIDTRFGIRGEMGMDAANLGTDPRMIQAITQTMIGEYLWKYTRKAGRGEMSENRHRRYFWVHPYTRTLYWSDRDPSTAGRSELRAKSISIEAVHIVGDDNLNPPGLHRKSLIIKSPGRTVKFTCTTGQRHETWFNALSYLLLRTDNENQADTEEVAGVMAQDDVDEFNPSIAQRPTPGNRPRVPPSLSSYNSRTPRTDSPYMDVSMSIPTLTPTREREVARSGTLGRLSGYWRASTIGGTFSSLSSLRSRSHIPQDDAIYEASEVPDSAEDVRQIIEQQDRESDRLENVRACCDGKHDVGTLSHTKRGRISNVHSHSHTHTHPGPSTTPTPSETLRSRT